jgi:hypothetical protein
MQRRVMVESLSPISDGVKGVWGATPITNVSEFNVKERKDLRVSCCVLLVMV